MKKVIYIIALLVSLPLPAQVSTYLSLRGGVVADSLSLEQILDSARHNNIALRTAQHNIEAAQQQRKEAFTKYFPKVSATGVWFNATRDMTELTINPSEMLSPQVAADLAQVLPTSALVALGTPATISMLKDGVLGSVTAVQPVFAGGQIVNGNRLAKVGEEVSSLQFQLSENEVEKNAEQYFWQLASLQEKLKTVQAAEDLLSDIHKDVNVAVRAGVVMPNDLLQVQLRQNEIESQKLKLQNGLSVVRMLLSQYCGLRDTSFVITYQIKEPSSFVIQQDPDQALQRTAEYQLLDKQVEAANLQRKMTVGQNLPTLGVGVGYNYHNLFNKGRSFGMVFATVNVPISDWWGGSHAIKRKKIELQKAVEQLDDNSELLKIRMQNAWNSVQESYRQLSIAKRNINHAEENLRLNRNYYKAGTSKMSDLLQAQFLYQQAQDKYTDVFLDYQNKLLEYKHAVGQ